MLLPFGGLTTLREIDGYIRKLSTHNLSYLGTSDNSLSALEEPRVSVVRERKNFLP